MTRREVPVQATPRAWSLRDRAGLPVDPTLLYSCGQCGLDGRRHEFDCPMFDRATLQ